MDAYLQPWSAFTASHRPIYSTHEIELAIIDRATLTFGSHQTLHSHPPHPHRSVSTNHTHSAPRFLRSFCWCRDEKVGKECSVSLSTHRLIFQQQATAHYIHLALVKRAELHTSFLSSPKLTVHLQSRPIAPPPAAVAPSDFLTYHTFVSTTTSMLINPPSPGYVRLTAPSDALQLLAAQLTNALSTRSYAATPADLSKATTASTASKQFSTSSAGVGGLMRDVDATARRTDATLDAAFTDLSALMAHAKDIVTLAQRFARTLAASTTHSTEEEAALASLLTTMGLPNPITKQTATASSFHSHLARQLSDFIAGHPSFQQQHMMTLTDVYCVYNRARGTDLISPDDCRRACELLSGLSVGMRLQRLEGGVMVVCRDGMVETGVEGVVSAVRNSEARGAGGLAVVELSGVLGVSVVLVEERCLLAEKRGWLVRDESVEGVRWWPNHFDDWTATDGAHSAAVT